MKLICFSPSWLGRPYLDGPCESPADLELEFSDFSATFDGEESKDLDASEALGGLTLDGVRETGTEAVDEESKSGDDGAETPESDLWLVPRRSLISFFLLRVSATPAPRHEVEANDVEERGRCQHFTRFDVKHLVRKLRK
jgi:hypothetical protein